MEGYVGFANLPNQVFRKSVKKGFEFTIMVVGEYSYNWKNGKEICSNELNCCYWTYFAASFLISHRTSRRFEIIFSKNESLFTSSSEHSLYVVV